MVQKQKIVLTFALLALAVVMAAMALVFDKSSPTGFAAHEQFAGFSAASSGFPAPPTVSFTSVSTQKAWTFSLTDDVVYKTAYVSRDGNTWAPVTLSGSAYQGSSSWIAGSASGTVAVVPADFGLSSSRTFSGDNYVIVYSCSKAGSSWDCHDGRWQLQQCNATLSVSPPSGSTIVKVAAVGQSAVGVRAHMVVSFDGDEREESVPESVTEFSYALDSVPSVIAMSFDNDFYAGDAEDRNLFIQSLSVDDVLVDWSSCDYSAYVYTENNEAIMLSNGTVTCSLNDSSSDGGSDGDDYSNDDDDPPDDPYVGEGTVWEINEALGRGVNVWGVVSDGSCAFASNWEDDYFDKIAEAGFDHVRLVIYGFRDGSGYAIDDDVLANLKVIVDQTIDAGLIAVLDYHSPAFLDNPSQDNQNRFVAHWGELAKEFKGYSNKDLVFELVNEPAGELSNAGWNILLDNAIKAIRAQDSSRAIIVSPATWASAAGLSDLVLPDDDLLILSLHYYQPHTFTHQCAGWIEGYDEVCGEQWYPIQPLIDEVQRYFEPVVSFSQEQDIPVIIGEFGTYYAAPMDSRVRYTNFLARYFELQGWSWAVWDFFVDYSFKIYDKGTESFIPELLDALVSDPMPAVSSHSTTVLYQSSFGSGTDGWYVTTEGSGSAGLSVSGGELVARVYTQGSAPESIVLRKSLPMEKGKMYRIQFTIRSSPDRYWMVARIARKYTWINLYDIDAQGQSQEFAFWYSNDDNPSGEMEFRIGGSSATFYVSDFRFEELSLA